MSVYPGPPPPCGVVHLMFCCGSLTSQALQGGGGGAAGFRARRGRAGTAGRGKAGRGEASGLGVRRGRAGRRGVQAVHRYDIYMRIRAVKVDPHIHMHVPVYTPASAVQIWIQICTMPCIKQLCRSCREVQIQIWIPSASGSSHPASQCRSGSGSTQVGQLPAYLAVQAVLRVDGQPPAPGGLVGDVLIHTLGWRYGME